MKIPTMLLQRVLLDVGLQLSDTIDLDYREICSRYEREGMSFLTITLPALDDALLQGLAKGRLSRTDYVGFRSRGRNGSLPALLSGFFRRIFHDDGSIRKEPDVCAIQAIRQVTRLFKKVELPCSKPRIKAAYERYLSNDREVDWRRHRTPLDTSLFASINGFLWAGLEVLSGELYCFPGLFGPGATAERVKRNERFTIKRWPERAEGSFPSAFYASHNEFANSTPGFSNIPIAAEEPVRVVQVPKTLKTPRTISVEPSYMMLMQQSIAKPLMVYLESERFGFQSIRFTDQSVNRSLARLGSRDGSLCTIDLKDASDLVDYDLVENIFRGVAPTFMQMIADCRTTTAKLPCGSIVPLKKFSSMGSAMCFPIESMVFFTIVMYALVKSTGRVPSRSLLRRLSKKVAVYGDDIIVPAKMAPVVMETLEDFGLRVNYDKSFHTGLFRESCGGDYYNGVDVTPAYVRHWDDTGTLSKASHRVAYTSLSNTFYMKGLWHACQYLRDFISSKHTTPVPLARHPIGVLHFSSYLYDSNLSWDTRLHGYRVRGSRVRVPQEDDSPSDLSGFLGRSLQSRYFRDRLREFKDQVCRPTGTRWFSESSDIYSIGGVSLDTPTERNVSSDHRSLVPEALPSTTPDWGSWLPSIRYSDEVRHQEIGFAPLNPHSGALLSEVHGGILHDPTGWRRQFGERLMHLNTALGTSLYTSERPHALCLKRGWTASQAGLNW